MTGRARSEDAIVAAALELMAELGVSGLTVDAVAARAGVGKQTIYRHWGSRARLVHDAISRANGPFEEPDTGTLRGDLDGLVGQLARFLTNPATGCTFPSLLDAAERDPELAQLRSEHARQKRAAFERVLRRAVDRGELPDDLDIEPAIDLLVGPLFYRRLVRRASITPASIRRHLDLALRALDVRAPART